MVTLRHSACRLHNRCKLVATAVVQLPGTVNCLSDKLWGPDVIFPAARPRCSGLECVVHNKALAVSRRSIGAVALAQVPTAITSSSSRILPCRLVVQEELQA